MSATTSLIPAAFPDHFGFSDDHALLRDTARRVLSEKCPFTEIRRLADDPLGFDPTLHAELAELGWTGLLIPDSHGGAGLDFLAMALVLEECGRALLPGPLWSTVMAGLAIDIAGSDGQKKRWLEPLARGQSIGTLAFTEPGGSWQPESVVATARRDGDGYRLDGVKSHVLWAHSAQVLVAPFVMPSATKDSGEEGTLALFAVPLDSTPGVSIAAESSIDSTRRTAQVTFDGARVDGSTLLHAGSPAAWRAIHVRGYALLAAEAVGAADAILTRTRDYACERVQFNRPIGAFQAVKHPLVNVLIAVERARSLIAGAAAALDAAPDQAEISARMAKAAASHALRFAADRGVQLHGGYGFTWDCDAHFFVKRALWCAATLGDEAHHRRHLAEHLLG